MAIASKGGDCARRNAYKAPEFPILPKPYTPTPDTGMDAVTECNPSQIVGPDGRIYIQKIPNHYLLYIPIRYCKEMVISRLANPPFSVSKRKRSSQHSPQKRPKLPACFSPYPHQNVQDQ
ncbi:hypothetical protein AYI68_g619 [Smittium mucronatum]|uniref:Uncharacterized protein n=1 Tax=Smittium mucronatum TaxID=133383 RepID=A0A1R0H7U8_9FUNG|nr:hypothetical protein AYI68_g619 [Smittium mucronatum]